MSASPTPARFLRVGIQGVPGAYSACAARDFYAQSSPPLEIVYFDTVDDVAAAIELGHVDKGLVPIENTQSGSFPAVYDVLLSRNVHVTAELVVREVHCLVGHQGVKIEDVTEVRSHPAVLDQCRGYLRLLASRNAGLALTQAMDTAASARYVGEDPVGRRTVAAIASQQAAELYGLQVLQEAIEDSDSIITRYVELALQAAVPPRHANAKTLMAFTLKNASGTLFKALSCFALRDINVCKIESRPQGQSLHPWELIFFVTVDASTVDETLKRALANLEEYLVGPFKLLGCFASTQMRPYNRSSLANPYGV
ncbi:hypothetical protein AMAG_06283 [Allomyces macrogynus ATCC 38327]|uniref:prephenate dehydratase n=1 Tax=Allomyces macrogynus (strain ATCC 38327) TaxID=578462 RepID=A0A0L0SG51_ALLM3|nr:hypothetical protein AMAG_06283 [Allomyces macrogynus ATCC 38327]|eukprot:KNE61463.1 hypothetical protein AMAG_06283 [Allomyces macrogynus ATCC 38327]